MRKIIVAVALMMVMVSIPFFTGNSKDGDITHETNLNLINVQDPEFGAIPNDGLDDSQAIYAAIDASIASGADGVWFPAENYILNR